MVTTTHPRVLHPCTLSFSLVAKQQTTITFNENGDRLGVLNLLNEGVLVFTLQERGGEWYTYRLTTVSTPTSGIDQYTAVWIAGKQLSS